MESQPPQVEPADAWTDSLAASLAETRQQVAGFLARQREKLQALETAVGQQHVAIQDHTEAVQAEAAAQADQAVRLASRHDELQSASTELEAAQDKLQDAVAHMERERCRLHEREQVCQTERERVLAEQAALTTQAAAAEKAQADVTALNNRTAAQRQRLAGKLRARRHVRRAERQTGRAELERLTACLGDLQAQAQVLTAAVVERDRTLADRDELLAATGQALEALEATAAELRIDRGRWQIQAEDLAARAALAADQDTALIAAHHQIDALRADEAALEHRLLALESELTAARHQVGVGQATGKALDEQLAIAHAALQSAQSHEAEGMLARRSLEDRLAEGARQLAATEEKCRDLSAMCDRSQADLAALREALAGAPTQDQGRQAILQVRQEAATELAAINARASYAEQQQAASAEQLRLLQKQLAEATREKQRLEADRSAAVQGAQVGDDGKASQELEDLQKRYGMAMDDLRELKRKYANLERADSSGGVEVSQGMDWEAQKRRMLASLEADASNDDDGDGEEERRQVRNVIRDTEAVVRARDEEIDELRKLLEHQSGSIGEVAVGAAALGEIFSNDAVIQQERERLNHLQVEWEDKLRQAEIELSVQRARLAREKAELDERQRSWQEAHTQSAAAETTDSKGKKTPVRGRWLARLGLTDENG